ncbi:MAG: hypothetical protein ABXS91_01610 [Sulfurimonas sp.]
MRSIKKPRGNKKSSSATVKKHFDYNNSIYAEKHYGKYLIVKNTKVDTNKHNRIYISRVEQIEFIKHPDNVYQKDTRQASESKFKKPTQFHLLDSFPEYKQLIWELLSTLNEKSTRPYTTSIIKGLGSILNILIGSNENLVLKDADSFNHAHHVTIQESINNNTTGYFDYISAAWKFIVRSRTYQDLPLSFSKPEVDQTKYAIPPDVVYQLDYYAQIELNEIVSNINQLQDYLKEFDSIDELFSLQNLAYTHYYAQGNNPAFNYTINRISKELYSIDLKCYRQIKYDKFGKRYFTYKDETQKQQHKKLLAIAKNGMDINISDEEMLILWLCRIAEDFPFLTKYKKPFEKVWATPIKRMAEARCKALGIMFSDFKNRITPSAKHLYPLFLLLSVRAGPNQEVIKSWTVNKTEDGKYKLGEKWGNGLMITGNKYRGNTEQVAIISQRSPEEKYIKAYLDWLSPVYDVSNSSIFLQYASEEGKVAIFTRRVIQSYLKQPHSFYNKYEIYDNEERIYSIDHRYLRASKNYSRYLEGYGKWVRQKELGHQSESTEPKHYRKSYEWKIGSGHQIASSQNQLISFIKGENNNQRLIKAFQTPFCECSDPKNPTYKNAKKIGDDDVCTSWRKCLTECNNPKSIIPSVHGPLITAWRDLMEEKENDFWRTEDWEKEFRLDIDAANSVLDQFTEEEKTLCSQQAPRYTQFINSLLLKAIENRTKRA